MPVQLVSTATEGVIKLSLKHIDMPIPKDDEVVVRVEASPINPSDLGLLFGPADLTTVKSTGDSLQADVPEQLRPALKARLGFPLPCGNEGSGVVIAAGKSPVAQDLLGKVVGVIGGGMYSQVRLAKAATVLEFPAGTQPRQCASWFVNPLTALGMVETMKAEGHTALVHTAAASNLGQMLNKICLKDGIHVVNIVRKEEHRSILMGLGAQYVVSSSSPEFKEELTAALAETGATLAFDATGGGKLANTILMCMEAAASRGKGYSVYGSDKHKQVYIYGGLDRSATILTRGYGMAWGVGGWLLTPFLQKAGRAKQNELRARVASEITTTFASSYSREVSLEEALDVAVVREYAQQATGAKFLINPAKGVTPAPPSKL